MVPAHICPLRYVFNAGPIGLVIVEPESVDGSVKSGKSHGSWEPPKSHESLEIEVGEVGSLVLEVGTVPVLAHNGSKLPP